MKVLRYALYYTAIVFMSDWYVTDWNRFNFKELVFKNLN